jgi:hypothetical protein
MKVKSPELMTDLLRIYADPLMKAEQHDSAANQILNSLAGQHPLLRLNSAQLRESLPLFPVTHTHACWG